MKDENVLKGAVTVFLSVVTSLFGALAIPVLLMVVCNVIDYVTGLMAAENRNDGISSYKSMKGIMKKVCMWLLVVVGAIIDQLLEYASSTIGVVMPFTFLVACIVAIWIICNEIISILENMIDIGTPIPPFLQPIIKNIKSQVETMAGTVEEKKEEK